MDWVHWQALYAGMLHVLERSDVDAVIISHGTDRFKETVFFLSQVLPFELLETSIKFIP